MTKKQFQKTIYSYYCAHRRDFPWRNTTDPYRIFVSEVMLQQTQAERVVPKYEAFIKKFPNFKKLSQAPTREVLSAWQGLGYNRRALALQKSAQIVVENYKGTLPDAPLVLDALPGIGVHTAGSIAAFAYNHPSVFIETNIRSVFIHFFFNDRGDVSDKELVPLVEKMLDQDNPREWYFALMDYGVMLKKTLGNPSRRSKHHAKQSKFIGSRRQVRGQILKLLLAHLKGLTSVAIKKQIGDSEHEIEEIIGELYQERFIVKNRNKWIIA